MLEGACCLEGRFGWNGGLAVGAFVARTARRARNLFRNWGQQRSAKKRRPQEAEEESDEHLGRATRPMNSSEEQMPDDAAPRP